MRNCLPRGVQDFLNFIPFCQYYLNKINIVRNKIILWSTGYSACVVYTKTIIHLSVGESDGYLPHRFATG